MSDQDVHTVVGRTPKYRQLKRELLAGFADGQFAPHKRLPSENELVRKTGYARSTVRQALGELEREGIIHRVQGKGTFVSARQDNPAARELGAFALILPEIDRDLYPLLAKGFGQATTKDHGQMIICSTDYDLHKQGSFVLQLIDRDVDGVAIVPIAHPPTPRSHLRQFHRRNIPVVFCHRRPEGASAPCITWDADRVADLAVRAFVGRGHRRVAYFGCHRNALSEAYERRLRQALSRRNMALPERRVRYGPLLTVAGREDAIKADLADILQAPDRPTAIFCNDDTHGELIYLLAGGMGVRIPDDLSVIGFGAGTGRRGFKKHLTSVTVNEYELGERAQAVLSEIRNGARAIDDNEWITVPVALYPGKTLAPAPETRGEGRIAHAGKGSP